MLNELPVGAAIAHGHEGAIARHVLQLARRDRLRHSYKADRQRQSGRQQRRIFYEIATRRRATPRLAFHPTNFTTILGDGQTSKGRKSYLFRWLQKGVSGVPFPVFLLRCPPIHSSGLPEIDRGLFRSPRTAPRTK